MMMLVVVVGVMFEGDTTDVDGMLCGEERLCELYGVWGGDDEIVDGLEREEDCT